MESEVNPFLPEVNNEIETGQYFQFIAALKEIQAVIINKVEYSIRNLLIDTNLARQDPWTFDSVRESDDDEDIFDLPPILPQVKKSPIDFNRIFAKGRSLNVSLEIIGYTNEISKEISFNPDLSILYNTKWILASNEEGVSTLNSKFYFKTTLKISMIKNI
jgi:hypothetical protein